MTYPRINLKTISVNLGPAGVQWCGSLLESDSVLESMFLRLGLRPGVSDAKDSDLFSSPQDSDSDLAHYRPMMLLHVTFCIETVHVCLRKFSRRLVSVFSTVGYIHTYIKL